MTNTQTFLTNIRDHLNNIQQLTEKYSPDNIRNYIMFYYQTFFNNLSLKNGTQADIVEMNLLYFSKFLKPNATACLVSYNRNNLEIYSSAALNFTQTMETDIALTVGQLEILRVEMKTMITRLVESLSTITNNRDTARQLFDDFVSFN